MPRKPGTRSSYRSTSRSNMRPPPYRQSTLQLAGTFPQLQMSCHLMQLPPAPFPMATHWADAWRAGAARTLSQVNKNNIYEGGTLLVNASGRGHNFGCATWAVPSRAKLIRSQADLIRDQPGRVKLSGANGAKLQQNNFVARGVLVQFTKLQVFSKHVMTL